MTNTVIDAVYNFAQNRSTFTRSELRKAVNSCGLIVGNETITRALRQLRDEGSVSYQYDASTRTYETF